MGDALHSRQLDITFMCLPMYGKGAGGIIALACIHFICALLSMFMIVLERKLFHEKGSCLKITVLTGFFLHSMLTFLEYTVPIPYPPYLFGYFCVQFTDIFYNFSWIMLLIWIGNAVVFPFIKSTRRRRFSAGLLYFWLFAAFICDNVAGALDEFSELFDTPLTFTSLIMDGSLVVVGIVLSVKLFLIYRLVSQVGSNARSLKQRLRIFFVMMCIITCIFVFGLAYDLSFFWVTTFPVSQQDAFRCQENEDTDCLKPLLLSAMSRFFEEPLPILVFLFSFLYFSLAQHSNDKWEEPEDGDLEEEETGRRIVVEWADDGEVLKGGRPTDTIWGGSGGYGGNAWRDPGRGVEDGRRKKKRRKKKRHHYPPDQMGEERAGDLQLHASSVHSISSFVGQSPYSYSDASYSYLSSQQPSSTFSPPHPHITSHDTLSKPLLHQS